MSGHSGNWECPLPHCTWNADELATNTEAMKQFKLHLHSTHMTGNIATLFENFDPKTKGYSVQNGVPIGIITRVEMELDHYIRLALEWPEVEGGVWDASEVVKLRDDLAKAKASAAGRGLAIALWHMHGAESPSNRFKSPDAVIRDAVERFKNPVPEDSHMGVSPSEQAEQAAAAAATRKAPATELNDEQKARIKHALEQNFDADTLAKMFKTSLEQIEACR